MTECREMKSNVSVWAMLPVRGKGLPSHVRGKGVTVSRESEQLLTG
jgi:hypothetical protein